MVDSDYFTKGINVVKVYLRCQLINKLTLAITAKILNNAPYPKAGTTLPTNKTANVEEPPKAIKNKALIGI